MRIVGTSVEYTEEDEKGFAFRPMNQESLQLYVRKHKAKRKTKLLLLIVLLVIGLVVDILLLPDDMSTVATVYYLVVIIVLGLGIQNDTSNIKLTKKRRALEFEVKIIRKCQVEDATSLGAGDIIAHSKLFPALVKDTTTGYESICYLPKELYNACSDGQIITLERFKRK